MTAATAATLDETVAGHAARRPDAPAYVTRDRALTWAEYDAGADGLGAALVDDGVAPGDRVAVLAPDGSAVHVAYLAIERVGGVIVGIGPRAGDREIEHLLGRTSATVLLSTPETAGLAARLGLRHRVLGDGTGAATAVVPADRGRAVGDLWLLNSTSGTTGLPKCVMHDQARWLAFHELAVDAGALTPDDVFMSVLPAPFGFGIWTGHVTPTLLGAPCVLMARFDADECLALIERERVRVLAAVSTQLVMLLNAMLLNEGTLAERHLSSLRVLFTGGEMVPYRRAAEFEDRTGCAVLQFYGSNETGALSRTTLTDDREHRLRTAGRVIPSMQVRLFAEGTDADGDDVTTTGGPGIGACKGPVNCLGYYDDPEANARLSTDDGWMLTGDLCTIDGDGFLTVAGRTSDFIIRGGKNISASQVEDEVSTHPAVALAAVVAMPDPVFGERVCVYVEQHQTMAPLTLAAL
ncbi:MAG: AMP-binding protein, partial [Acidimicrobiia bacterium]|nr:AMP-binding protein [Acidimicrobiia bacterium]